MKPHVIQRTRGYRHPIEVAQKCQQPIRWLQKAAKDADDLRDEVEADETAAVALPLKLGPDRAEVKVTEWLSDTGADFDLSGKNHVPLDAARHTRKSAQKYCLETANGTLPAQTQLHVHVNL